MSSTVPSLTPHPPPDPAEALSMSHISEILGTSSLSDEEIQQLIEQLLEKMNANAEWEAVSWASIPYATLSHFFNSVIISYAPCVCGSDNKDQTPAVHSNYRQPSVIRVLIC